MISGSRMLCSKGKTLLWSPMITRTLAAHAQAKRQMIPCPPKEDEEKIVNLVVPLGLRLGFLGSGRVAQAVAEGLVHSGLVAAEDVTASDPLEPNLKLMSVFGAKTTKDNKDVLPACDVAMLCVKPHILPELLNEVAPVVTDNHLVISVVTGINTQQLNSMLYDKGRIIRMVPNTPCLVRCGVTAFSAGARATPDDCNLATALFSSMGVCEELPEGLLDATTALCGSGPAFVFQMIEAMADGGVRMGLPRALAQHFATQTVKGAATMVQQTGSHPAELKDAVCSPGGTTMAGIHKLERGGLRAALMDAVQASTEKAMELGKQEHFKTLHDSR